MFSKRAYYPDKGFYRFSLIYELLKMQKMRFYFAEEFLVFSQQSVETHN